MNGAGDGLEPVTSAETRLRVYLELPSGSKTGFSEMWHKSISTLLNSWIVGKQELIRPAMAE
jgi:hypothetical protein